MKKKLSMIVFAAVLIAFTCMYAIVDKNNAIYDRAVDTSQYVALGLEQGEMVSQSFISKEDRLDGMNIKMSVSGQANEKKISYVEKAAAVCDACLIGIQKATPDEKQAFTKLSAFERKAYDYAQLKIQNPILCSREFFNELDGSRKIPQVNIALRQSKTR